jgi:hypothetical protein
MRGRLGLEGVGGEVGGWIVDGWVTALCRRIALV